METQTQTQRNIKRRVGRRFISGTLTISGKRYRYQFPKLRNLKTYLTLGDIAKIAKLTGFSRHYVRNVLDGVRFNEIVIIEAIKWGKRNRTMGFIEQKPINVTHNS